MSLPTPPAPLLIGGARGDWNIGAGTFFNGLIDEVQIYNRALTDLEIENLYRNPPAFSPAGNDVVVQTVSEGEQPTSGTLTFSEVLQPGVTTIAPVAATAPPLPGSFSLGDPPAVWDITTTAVYSGSIEVCLSYENVNFGDPSNLLLLHYNSTLGAWEQTDSWIDPESETICGTVTSLSPLAVAEVLDLVPPVVLEVRTSPSVVSVNAPVILSAQLEDSGGAGLKAVEYKVAGGAPVSLDDVDGTTDEVSVDLEPFPSTGVYELCVRAEDQSFNFGAPECILLPVYDPDGGFVTGGGWIFSTAGSYVAEPLASGKATFGFVSKYKKGASVPSGDTQFQFQTVNLNFKSSAYEWLVISGARAQFKGDGTINGTGSYGFLLTAVDGQVTGGGGSDRFRIKIWDKATGSVVYDNQMGAADDAILATILGGGSIVIHKDK